MATTTVIFFMLNPPVFVRCLQRASSLGPAA
jgi:hypothetical protein